MLPDKDYPYEAYQHFCSFLSSLAAPDEALDHLHKAAALEYQPAQLFAAMIQIGALGRLPAADMGIKALARCAETGVPYASRVLKALGCFWSYDAPEQGAVNVAETSGMTQMVKISMRDAIRDFKVNRHEAGNNLRRAAQGGHPTAQVLIGICDLIDLDGVGLKLRYPMRDGVDRLEKRREEAAFFFEQASFQRMPMATELVIALEDSMSKPSISQLCMLHKPFSLDEGYNFGIGT